MPAYRADLRRLSERFPVPGRPFPRKVSQSARYTPNRLDALAFPWPCVLTSPTPSLDPRPMKATLRSTQR